MINVAAVLRLCNYPSMATYGGSSIGWYIIGTISFLIPLTLAEAELATGWPQGGGVYAWMQEAFGETAGFIAVFCEWSNNLVWFPTVLAFIASTFAYVSSRFGSFRVISGSIIPAIMIIVLGVIYTLSDKPLALPSFSVSATVPTINISTLPFIATVALLFAGMEMAGFHALEVQDQQRDFPKAMAVSSVIIFILTVLGTLAISVVVPINQLSLAAGLMKAFQALLDAVNLTWLLAPLALLVTLGSLGFMACLLTLMVRLLPIGNFVYYSFSSRPAI